MLTTLSRHDSRLIGALAAWPAPRSLDRALRTVTHLGGATAISLACGLLLAVPATRPVGLGAALASLLSHLLVQALKRAVTRPRPTTLQPHIAALVALPDEFSFPSGHACSAMAVAVAITLAAPPAGIAALPLAFAVGASRVYLRVHYPTDVIVGQLLGMLAASGVHWSLA